MHQVIKLIELGLLLQSPWQDPWPAPRRSERCSSPLTNSLQSLLESQPLEDPRRQLQNAHGLTQHTVTVPAYQCTFHTALTHATALFTFFRSPALATSKDGRTPAPTHLRSNKWTTNKSTNINTPQNLYFPQPRRGRGPGPYGLWSSDTMIKLMKMALQVRTWRVYKHTHTISIYSILWISNYTHIYTSKSLKIGILS